MYNIAPNPIQGSATPEILKEIICPVIVVPMFAPSITDNA